MASQANSLRQDELPEYPFVGPFGGIQSEVALSQIGRTGFVEIQNLLLRKSQAQTVPPFVPLSSPSNEAIMGIADFFNASGLRLPVVWTPTKMYYYLNGGWTQVTGTAFTGSASQFFQWDVIGYKLYFSQGKNPVQVWDGISAGYSVASASAVPAKYLVEVDFHLLVGNVFVSGNGANNTVYWTGAGDGTDWTSFNSGVENLYNALGPINGMARLYQYGYVFQQWGITQVIPTGIGIAPFQFVPLGSKAKGSTLPYALASFGEQIACYVGKDNVYLFDGSQSYPIGSRPIDGNRMLGARSRIFSDLFLAPQTNVFGFIMSSSNGTDYDSYWIFIPGLNKAWVYHFDEMNWVQVFFTPGQLNGPVGVFSPSNAPRIKDLVGSILSQSWVPATLVTASVGDTPAISDANAKSISPMAFGSAASIPTSGSINSNDGWYIKSGELTFDDSRHVHSIKKVRMCFIDYGNVTVSVRWTNEIGIQQQQQVTFGTGSGHAVTKVIEFKLSGKYLTFEISGPQGIPFSLTEITPIYDVGGEVACG